MGDRGGVRRDGYLFSRGSPANLPLLVQSKFRAFSTGAPGCTQVEFKAAYRPPVTRPVITLSIYSCCHPSGSPPPPSLSLSSTHLAHPLKSNLGLNTQPRNPINQHPLYLCVCVCVLCVLFFLHTLCNSPSRGHRRWQVTRRRRSFVTHSLGSP